MSSTPKGTAMIADDDNDMSAVAIGPPETGVPLPRADGFIGRLRRNLEQLEVGGYCNLLNVNLKHERYIRSRLPILGRELNCKFTARVADHKRDRSVKRTLRVWRLE
jgi:hypothetical protein